MSHDILINELYRIGFMASSCFSLGLAAVAIIYMRVAKAEKCKAEHLKECFERLEKEAINIGIIEATKDAAKRRRAIGNEGS